MWVLRFMKMATLLCIVAIIVWQIQLWFGKGSLAHVRQLTAQLHEQQQKIEELEARNAKLAANVNELKTGTDTIEAIARRELGLIKPGETFFMVVPDAEPSGQAGNDSQPLPTPPPINGQ